MFRPFPLLATAFLAAPLLHAQVAGPLDFEAPGQLSTYFRATLNGGTASEANDGTNGYVQVLGNTGTTPWIGVYDSTPANGADAGQTFAGAFTLHLDFSAANSNSSFGIFLFQDGSPANNLLAIFNLDSAAGGAGNEQIRFWRDSSLSSSVVSNPYTTSSFTGTNGVLDTASNGWVTSAVNRGDQVIDFAAPYTFYSLDFIYDPTALTLQVASGTFSATLNIPAGDVISNPSVAVRLNDGVVDASNTARFDNFSIKVPEPGSAALLACGALGLALRRRRRRVR